MRCKPSSMALVSMRNASPNSSFSLADNSLNSWSLTPHASRLFLVLDDAASGFVVGYRLAGFYDRGDTAELGQHLRTLKRAVSRHTVSCIRPNLDDSRVVETVGGDVEAKGGDRLV